MLDEKALKAAAKDYAELAFAEMVAGGPRPLMWKEIGPLLEETFIAAFEKAEAIKKDPAAAEPPHCNEMANVQINFVKRAGPDHAFACWKHSGALLEKIIPAAIGGAARVSKLPLSSDDQCELGVE